MGKVRVSAFVTQAVLSGRGWEEAERLVKTPDAAGVLRLHPDQGVRQASFEGFECRWQAVPSFSGHKLSLLVAAMAPDAETNSATIREVVEQIQALYGDIAQYHPLRVERMQLAFSPRLLSHEMRVRAGGAGLGRRLAYLARAAWLNAAGCYLFSRNIDTASVRWSRYREDMVDNSDFRKFDGVLRMVIDGSDVQSDALQHYLENAYRAGRLAYGLHKSRAALVTCIVQSYNGNHQHFVDGSDGGYALAARELKRRLAALRGAGA